MRTIKPLIFIGILIAGCSELPSGNLTVIECTVINELTDKPISNKNIQIRECGVSFGAARGCLESPPNDSVRTDENGFFKYAFFHDNGVSYFISEGFLPDSFCMKETRVFGGTFLRETIKMKPLKQLLKVRLVVTDSLQFADVRVRSSFECVAAFGPNHFRKREVAPGFDTTLNFFVPPLDTVSVRLDQIEANTEIRGGKTIEVFIENSPLILEL